MGVLRQAMKVSNAYRGKAIARQSLAPVLLLSHRIIVLLMNPSFLTPTIEGDSLAVFDP
jgi:hypothetical protein